MAEKNRTALRISLIAIMTAVVAVFTLVVRIPSPIGGYISLCDAAVSFVAYAFGPVSGLIAGGLGAAFADLIGGYPQWAVISFIVHGLEAFLMGLIVKKGSHGAYTITKSEQELVPGVQVKNVVDTVGAGDSFTAAFVSAILKGMPVEDAHRLAVATSAYVCTQNGAMPVLPYELTGVK